jgi:hypothetical protein
MGEEGEVQYVVERYSTTPFVVLYEIPERISELYEAGLIKPHLFTWDRLTGEGG